MKSSIMNQVICLNFIQFVMGKEYNFFPNLPAGEFIVFYKAILQCEPRVKSGFQFNWYISKKSANSTEIKGNLTFDVPFDDSYDVAVNFAVKDLIGGWKDNAHLVKLTKVCQTMRNSLGDSWIPFLKSHGMNNYDCPIPPGQYVISSGLDTSILANSRTNWPKIFFYGSYKMKSFFMKNKRILGCYIFVIDVKRPWETEYT